jgi:hypothetical protein
VLNIALSGNNITHLICVDTNEREFFIPTQQIISFDDKIIFERVSPKQPHIHTLQLGKLCFTQNGKYLGRLNDYEHKNFSIKYAIIGNKKIEINRLTHGDIVIVNTPSTKQETAKASTCQCCPHKMLIGALCN